MRYVTPYFEELILTLPQSIEDLVDYAIQYQKDVYQYLEYIYTDSYLRIHKTEIVHEWEKNGCPEPEDNSEGTILKKMLMANIEHKRAKLVEATTEDKIVKDLLTFINNKQPITFVEDDFWTHNQLLEFAQYLYDPDNFENPLL